MSENEQNNPVSESEKIPDETLTESENSVPDEPLTEDNGQISAETANSALTAEYARREYFAARRYKRTPLILAMIGLILSFFYGAGIAFSVAAIVTAAVRSRKVKSPTFRWALAIGITGAAICLVCYAMLVSAVCLPTQIVDF